MALNYSSGRGDREVWWGWVGLNPNEIDEFAKTGHSHADKLRSAWQIARFIRPGESADRALGGPIYYGGKPEAPGEDISNVYSAFLDWKNKSRASREAWDKYVDETRKTRGRAATILVPGEEKAGKTLLGGA